MSEEKNEALGFETLGIAEKLLESLKKLGMTSPTPIQFKSIPVAVEGKDIIGIAQTGTGKTLAFSIPMIQRLALYKGQGLVLLPTRELAIQVDESVRKYGAALGIRTAVLIGGESMNRQRDMLRRLPHVIVGTPGRINDFIQRGWVKMDSVKVLVLDEADMMLDMGFAPQIETIINKIPKERQTMLFSATMPTEIIRLSARHMAEPVRIEVAPAGQTAAGINQEIFIIHKEARVAQLEKMLKESTGPVLIFCRTKRGVKKLTEQIELMGYRAAEIHSNRSLEQRRKALTGFKQGKYRVLVATDIAARGIDVKDIELVINFDLPEDPGDYVHRIGRTGRAGKTGKAVSFAAPDQIRDIRQIERLINKSIPLTKMAEFTEGHGGSSNYNRRRPARGYNKPYESFGGRSESKPYKKFGSDRSENKPYKKFGSDSAEKKPYQKFGSDKFESKPYKKFSSDSAEKRPFKKFGSDRFEAKPYKKFSDDKFKRSEGSSDYGYSKFKPGAKDSRPERGYSKPASSHRTERSPRPVASKSRPSSGGFDPMSYFSNRPETRILTDKERFRASLREGDDRPSFGRKKNFGSRAPRR
jgi:ATP-dependent RNA helicase RhlE